MAKNIFC